ncbi:hypothetical protein [Erythrobacter sp. YT30]|nr:hypothetical protein [Erythrobacter sp. YT30]
MENVIESIDDLTFFALLLVILVWYYGHRILKQLQRMHSAEKED